MPILQVEHLSKNYGIVELFRDLSFVLNKGQKVGLIAPNGSGKSTLMRIIAGEEVADAGSVTRQSDVRMAYLPQESDFGTYPDILSACISGVRPEIRETIADYERALQLGDTTALARCMDRMEAVGAWAIEQELTALLSKLHIDEPLKPTKGLSGGESKRIALAAMLLGEPDVMILDEPTNHLDPDVIEWLEEYLRTKPVTLFMVTHDRYFLDRVVDTIFEIDDHSLYSYQGNYSKYLEKREERLQQLRCEQQSLRNTYRRELEWIRSTPQARSSKAKYRKDAFRDTESKLRTIRDTKEPKLDAAKVYIGKKIFEARHLSLSYGDRVIIKDFSYDFARHDRVGVIGPNGAGKTSFIHMIMGLLTPSSGTISVGETVRFGYFSQHPPLFPQDKKVIDVVTDKAEHVRMADGHSITAMQFLNHFLFPPARQQDYVAKLSGGEKRRLQLCTVLMDSPNFLVLDEPTNDLDIPTLRVLEEYLYDFDGCLIIVSHDRYFMDRLTDHLFVIPGDGTVVDFAGNYTDYREQSRQTQSEARSRQRESAKAAKESAAQPEDVLKGTVRKIKRSYNEEREYSALTERIPELEEEIRTIEQTMSEGTLSPDELMAMGQRYAELKEQLDVAELRWLELSEIGG